MKTQIIESSAKSLKVRKGLVDSVDLYEVKEHELEILANGESTGIYLNLSIFLFSISASAIISLATAEFKAYRTEMAFLFVAILGILVGLVLIILWWINRKSIATIIKRIKDRIPKETYIENKFEDKTISFYKNEKKDSTWRYPMPPKE